MMCSLLNMSISGIFKTTIIANLYQTLILKMTLRQKYHNIIYKIIIEKVVVVLVGEIKEIEVNIENKKSGRFLIQHKVLLHNKFIIKRKDKITDLDLNLKTFNNNNNNNYYKKTVLNPNSKDRNLP